MASLIKLAVANENNQEICALLQESFLKKVCKVIAARSATINHTHKHTCRAAYNTSRGSKNLEIFARNQDDMSFTTATYKSQ